VSRGEVPASFEPFLALYAPHCLVEFPLMSRSVQQLDATIEVVTPENIAFHYRVAGPFSRLAALLMDYALRLMGFGAICLLTLLILALLAIVLPGIRGVFTFLSSFATAILVVSWFVLDWFYGGILETYWNGQTLGKRIFGLRVLTIHGEPINGLQAVLRNVLRYVDLFPLLSLEIFNGLGPEQMFENQRWPSAYVIPTLIVGLVAMMLNRRYQRLGDLVCGTMVVIDERQWLTGIVKLEDQRASQLAGLLPADFVVSPTLARALAMYVDRRRFFSFARRREIAKHLAEPLLKRFGLPLDTSYDLLLCALYYRAFVADLGDAATGTGEDPFRTEQPFRTEDPFRRSALGPPTSVVVSVPSSANSTVA